MSLRNAPAREAAARLLVAGLRPALIAYFGRRCSDRAEAEDLAQEAIVRALSHAGWSSDDQARAYIFKIAANLWKDRGRRLVSRRALMTEWHDGGESPIGRAVDEQLASAEELEQVICCIDELRERSRDMFLLYRLENMKHQEIAALYGVSLSTVEKEVAGALAFLTSRLRSRNGDSDEPTP